MASNDRRQLVFFPDEFLQLQAELQYHPQLLLNLANHRADDFELKFAEIATYCEVMLDGDYDEGDFKRLAVILLGKLKQKRGARSSLIL